jgi:hypothetical protein
MFIDLTIPAQLPAYMGMLTNILVAVHVVNSALWVGAVFMGSVIDPPALKNSADGQPSFLVNFIVMQGARVFPWVYAAMSLIFLTGLSLTWLHPPQNTMELSLVIAKFIALGIMAGNTLYGTFVTWPKIQFATPEEVFVLWRPYLIRAYVTLACGIAAFIMGVMLK